MIVALVLSAIVGLFWTTAMVRNPNLRGFLGHLFLFSNFDPVNHQSINSILWTAIVECYFYLLFPFLIWGCSRWGRWRFLILVAVFCWGYFFLVSFFTVPGEARVMWQHTFPGLWWKWCLGVGVAEIYLSETEAPWSRVVSRPIVLFTILIVSFTPCLFTDVHHVLGFHRFVLPLVVAAGILGIATSPAGFLEFPFLRWIGRVSYSIYLFHPLVLVGFSIVTLGAWWWDLLPFLFLAVATGAAGYYLVEVPGMRLKAKKVPVASAVAGTSLS
jgi:peptidoglycan/LPS O-acetylase OafA/YrhL